MQRFSIVIPVYDQYELFRECYEAIINHVNLETYKEIIVVDDYSDPEGRLRKYLEFIDANNSKVKVIKFDVHKASFHCNDKDMAIGKEKFGFNILAPGTTMGHAFALATGIKQVHTEFVFCLDPDAIMLKASKNCLSEIGEMFNENEKVMAIGQICGLMSEKQEICKERFSYQFGNRKTTCGGDPGSPAFACRMSGWTEKGLSPFAHKPTKLNWAPGLYCNSLFAKGYYTANYPILSNKSIFHIGGMIMNRARPGRRMEDSFGFTKGMHQRYGPRQGENVLTDWYAGRYVVNMTTKEYIKYLQDKYNKPFSEIQSPMDENCLHIVSDETSRPQKIEYYLNKKRQ